MLFCDLYNIFSREYQINQQKQRNGNRQSIQHCLLALFPFLFKSYCPIWFSNTRCNFWYSFCRCSFNCYILLSTLSCKFRATSNASSTTSPTINPTLKAISNTITATQNRNFKGGKCTMNHRCAISNIKRK